MYSERGLQLISAYSRSRACASKARNVHSHVVECCERVELNADTTAKMCSSEDSRSPAANSPHLFVAASPHLFAARESRNTTLKLLPLACGQNRFQKAVSFLDSFPE
eukprot:3822395-Pleurochrysis_carterae.AAC.1